MNVYAYFDEISECELINLDSEQIDKMTFRIEIIMNFYYTHIHEI